MAESTNEKEAGTSQSFLILFVGFFLFFIGVIVLIVAAVLSGGPVNFGGFIFIGPIPIVFGAGPEATWMVLLAVILAVLSVLMFLILYKEMKKTV